MAEGSYAGRWVCLVKVIIAKMKWGREGQCRLTGAVSFQIVLEKRKKKKKKREPGLPSHSC